MSDCGEMRADIAIVGGGMVGVTLALMLAAARRNWRVVIIESFDFPRRDSAMATADQSSSPQDGPRSSVNSRQPLFYQPSFDARSSALAAGSVEILTDLGVWQGLAQNATPIRQVHVSDKGHFGASLIDSETYGLSALGYVLENSWMGAVLLNALQRQPNLTCLAPATVRSLFPRRGGAELLVSSREPAWEKRLWCQLAVIADGADSPLRQSLGIDVQITDYRQVAVVANVAFDRPHRGIAYERFTATGPLALLPLDGSPQGQRSALVWTLPKEQAQLMMALSDAEFMQRLQQRFGYRLGRFLKLGQRHGYPLQRVLACEQVRSSLVMMGNAAHFLHPVAGQGFNLALRDCAALAETLSQAATDGWPLGHLHVLERYLRTQNLDQMLTAGFSDTLIKLFSSATQPLALGRTLGFFGLDLLPPAKHILAAQTMGRAGRQVHVAPCL